MKTKNNAPKTKKPLSNVTRLGKVFGFIGSVIGALLLWIYAIGYDSTLFESTFDGVEVVIEGEDVLASEQGFTLADAQKFSSITVVAKGKRSELNELTSEDFRAVIDVSKVTSAGEQVLDIVVYSPNGIEIASQSSATASVYVDEFTQRNELLSVSVDTGKNYIMAEGITFVEAVANPLSVTVSGPASALGEIDGAYVSFDLDGIEIKDHIYGYGAIELRDKNGKPIDNPYVSISETTAYVSITVTKQKTVPVRVAFSGGVFSPSDASVTLSSESVTVSGRPEDVDPIDEFVLSIDETAIDGRATYDFPVNALLPSGVSNESGTSKITVEVVLPTLASRRYIINPEKILFKNLPEGYTASVTNELTVAILGPREEFDVFDPEGISVSVDFNNVTVGADGSYVSKADVTLTSDSAGLYIQNNGYTVTYTIAEEEQTE